MFFSNTEAKIVNTYCKDFYSFCTVIDKTNVLSKIRLKVLSCYFEDLQDGINMVLNPASVVDVKVDKLKLELDFLDVEAGSRGINISGVSMLFIFNKKLTILTPIISSASGSGISQCLS